eukprot:TRINITY_DN9721_c0_g1_i2.p4 TRINITY_DN9721_c0_g1~~TRINITY_DN9721_c0_g1_i2.p4  ORF type:complete len:102 (-),score=26.89 TRINITY_DN9721_c0_g1_i2:159-464(-)
MSFHQCGCFFFFQAEDGIRDHAQSRGLGDVYKRQVSTQSTWGQLFGQIPTCPVCLAGKLQFFSKTGEYKCIGNKDNPEEEQVNCNVTLGYRDIKRQRWVFH